MNWWGRFDDPMLESLIASAMDANTSVKAGAAAMRQARALRNLAAAGSWPTLDGAASARRTTSGTGDDQRSSTNTYQAGLEGNWLVDFFGVNRSATRAADASVWESAANLGDIQVQIAAEIGISYILLRSAQARLETARSNLSSQQDTLQIAQWREQAGLASSIEPEQARTSAEQTSAGLPLLQLTIDQTSHAIAVLAGQPPAAMKTALSVPGPVPHANSDINISMPSETLRQRADVRAAEYRMAAAIARLSQARAAQRPNFSLGGSLGLSSLALSSLTDGASVVRTIVAGVTLPIFDAGAGRARVQSQQAALDSAEQDYRATVLGALQDVEDALSALRDDRLRLDSLRNAATAGAAAAGLSRQLYESGLVDFQIVLETQRTQLFAQDSVTTADANVSADYVRLYKALGGGWRPDDMAASAPTRSLSKPSKASVTPVSKRKRK